MGEDFDRGFGVGGLGHHEEHLIPSEDQIKAMDEWQTLMDSERVCTVCGRSEFDGAMFTTIATGSVCDDCL